MEETAESDGSARDSAREPVSDPMPESTSDAIRDALTTSEKRLGVAVLGVNLALGGWFIAHSDFSKVLPNRAQALPERAAPSEAMPVLEEESLLPFAALPAKVTPPDPGAGAAPVDAAAPRLADLDSH